jgi:large subunit ribosomal protein L21
MFAVVRTGGKQYRVAPGDKIVVEKLDGSAGDQVTLGDVLLAGDGAELKKTDGLTVAAEIVAQAKGDKVTVFKKRRRHNYRRKKGHRQQHTILRIVAIGDHKAAPKKAEAAGKPAKAKSAPAGAEAVTPSAAPAKAAKPKAAEATAAPRVETIETPNPAPNNEAAANPPADTGTTNNKSAGGKKATAGGKAAKAASTQNAAPAKGAAKKTPKAK